ncbi:MAG: hypothetical protein KQ78_02003 [Candidatus Izimaplasma bacterium HR2]|nr:MAG: hypothetical protein KQ78_02003 [Candidatus Izimaplasma bacterium HR2]
MNNIEEVVEKIDLGNERILKIIDGADGRFVRVSTTNKNIIYESKVINDVDEMENHLDLIKRIYG